MSIINSTYRYIFVHIPKCGGTSLTLALSPFNQYNDIEIGSTPYGEEIAKIYSPRHRIWKHSFAREIQAVVGRKTWVRYYSFTLVRNPYLRAISTFAYLKMHEHYYEFMRKYRTIDEFVVSEDWKGGGPDRMLQPQSLWVCDSEGRLIVNEVFKLEGAREAIQQIGDKIGLNKHHLENLSMPHTNTSKREFVSLRDVSRTTLEMIARRYESDFRLFGYEYAAPDYLLDVASRM